MELSKEDCEYCQDLTKQLLAITLHGCEELELEKMQDANEACLDKKRWKKLHSNAETTVYTERHAKSALLPTMRRQDWEHPVAVTAVGRMECTLDDVLFAMMTPDTATQRLRSFIMDQRPRKTCQVVPIEMPTEEAPFHFLGVTRFLSPHLWPFTMFKAPREMIMACATGDITTATGKRYAYELAQSVELRWKGTQNSRIPRSRAVQARIFWEQRDGSIAVFSKLIINAHNCLSDSFMRMILSRAVLGFGKFVSRSLETKKLWWCVKNKKWLTTKLRAYSHSQTLAEVANCKVKSQCKQTAVTRCEFCEKQLCGGFKCRISGQLKMIISNETGILEQTLTLCPRCAVFVRNQNAADIARARLVETGPNSSGKCASFLKTSTSQGGNISSLTSFSSTASLDCAS